MFRSIPSLRSRRIGWVASAALVAAGASIPAPAICTIPRLITNEAQYVFTGDEDCLGETCTTFASQTSVSGNLQGLFWVLGAGNPDFRAGVDNGRFAPRGISPYTGTPTGGWLRNYPLYPAYIESTWAANQRIDGCPDKVPHLKDILNSRGSFNPRADIDRMGNRAEFRKYPS